MHHRSELTRCIGSGLLLLLLTACQNEAPAANETSAIVPQRTEPSSAAPQGSSAVVPARAEGPANACALLPASEVEPIVGRAVRDSLALSTVGSPDALSQCNYGTLQNPAAATLAIRRLPDGQTTRAASDSIRQRLTTSRIMLEDVTGLGEVSFWGANQLHVLPGNGWYLVVSPEPGVGLPQAREMAQRAMSRF